MRLHADITRADIVRLNLYMLFRSRGSIAVFLALAAVIFALGLAANWPTTTTAWVSAGVGSLLGAFAGLLVGGAISVVWVLASSTEKGGVLGAHTYEVLPEGFRERTAHNESLYKWPSLLTPIRTKSFLLVRVNSFLFHVLPRRAFADQAEYEAVWQELISRTAGVA